MPARGWDQSVDVVQYGPDIGTEADFKLLGQLEGKRVLNLGCGSGHGAVACAKQGAHVIAVDASAEQFADAKRLAEREDVRVELHHSDLADLAFVRADTIDVAFSVYALREVEDLNRLFRQVHRTMHTGASFVFSVPHPTYDAIYDGTEPLGIRRSYFDREPIFAEGDVTEFPRTISDLVTGLTRANFSVDTLLEPEPLAAGPHGASWRDAFLQIPPTLIIRARKEGI